MLPSLLLPPPQPGLQPSHRGRAAPKRPSVPPAPLPASPQDSWRLFGAGFLLAPLCWAPLGVRVPFGGWGRVRLVPFLPRAAIKQQQQRCWMLVLHICTGLRRFVPLRQHCLAPTSPLPHPTAPPHCCPLHTVTPSTFRVSETTYREISAFYKRNYNKSVAPTPLLPGGGRGRGGCSPQRVPRTPSPPPTPPPMCGAAPGRGWWVPYLQGCAVMGRGGQGQRAQVGGGCPIDGVRLPHRGGLAAP